jgi:2-keto-4-pentenoate hydratase/2-oxohepta-3-ene-1,7-dioic acid hydratase in catechol pathway
MKWIRFVDDDGLVAFGTLNEADDPVTVAVHHGDLFADAATTGRRLCLDEVTVLPPCQPTKMIGLWNNSRSVAAKQGWPIPAEPLYFLKAPSSFIGHRGMIRRPASYDGHIVYEGELGIVIGTTCTNVALADVDEVVFGYTCVNDITALGLINADPQFAQWSRAKGFDTFGAFGPVISTHVDPDLARIRTLVGGKVRQEYNASDLIFSPRQLVSLLSRDMTLCPGDLIACGTSGGVLSMRPGVPVDVCIDGIGQLTNALQPTRDHRGTVAAEDD